MTDDATLTFTSGGNFTPKPLAAEWKSSEINELAAALAQAQGEIEHAAKDSINPHFSRRYASLASVREATRDPLSKHNLAVVQLPVGTGGTVQIITVLMHSSGQWVRSDGVEMTPKDPTNPQALKTCATYARRVGLEAITNTAPDDDDDGNLASGSREESRPMTKERLEQEAPKPTTSTKPISEKQVNRLWAVAKAAGREKGDVVDYLKSLGYSSSSEITRDRYDEIIAWVELEGEQGII